MKIKKINEMFEKDVPSHIPRVSLEFPTVDYKLYQLSEDEAEIAIIYKNDYRNISFKLSEDQLIDFGKFMKYVTRLHKEKNEI